MSKLCTTALALGSSLLVAACGGMPASAPMFSQDTLPDAVKVPGGHRVASARSPMNAAPRPAWPAASSGCSSARRPT